MSSYMRSRRDTARVRIQTKNKATFSNLLTTRLEENREYKLHKGGQSHNTKVCNLVAYCLSQDHARRVQSNRHHIRKTVDLSSFSCLFLAVYGLNWASVAPCKLIPRRLLHHSDEETLRTRPASGSRLQQGSETSRACQTVPSQPSLHWPCFPT